MDNRNKYQEHLGEGKIRFYKYVMDGKKHDHLDISINAKQGWPVIFIPHLEQKELQNSMSWDLSNFKNGKINLGES